MDSNSLQLLRARDATLPASARREAFGHLVAAHQDAAFSIAYAVLGDSHLAQDAALEGFIDAWRNLNSLRNPEAFGGWLRALVRARALRSARRHKVQMTPIETLGELPDTHELPNRERRIVIWQALEQLPDRERESVVLFHLAGLTREEIASMTGTSTVSVKKRLARALVRLRGEILEMANHELKSDMPSHNDDFHRQALLLSGRFAELLSARRPILLALDDCIAEAGSGPVQAAFADMRAQVTENKAMADAMRRHPNVFDSVDADAVLYGEQTGLLHDVLRQIAEGERFLPPPDHSSTTFT